MERSTAQPTGLEGPTAIARSLSPITYFRRNLGRTLPLAFVIVLSVFLIASVVTVVNSIDLTVLTIYNYTKVFTPVLPRIGAAQFGENVLRVPPGVQAQIRKTPGVDRMIETSGFFFNINTVFGPFPFVCFGVKDGDRDYLMKRAGDTLVPGGRMPAPGKAEAVISEGLAHNKKVKIGDVIASPLDTGTLVAAPAEVHLVGILKGPTWMAFTSRQFTDEKLAAVPRSLLVTTKNPADQGHVADTLFDTLDKFQVQVLSFNNLVKTLRKSLASMYLIMHLVNGTVIFVVALMAGMLSNIYFTQRISEFAVLAAIGLRRSTLVWHAVSETTILTTIGWGFGVLINWGVLTLMKGSVFEPRGMLIDPGDPASYLNTLPIPVFITLFAIATISIRLSRLDPVTIIERR